MLSLMWTDYYLQPQPTENIKHFLNLNLKCYLTSLLDVGKGTWIYLKI